jgi:DNA-binding transcriptional ArsR family regulator
MKIIQEGDLDMKISELLLNPARLRIIQYISLHGEATAGNVCQSMQDIPKATVYRHTKLLEDSGLLQIVKENRIRGTMEKVYSVNMEVIPIGDKKAVLHLATGYFIGLLRDMEMYLTENDIDLKGDMIFFNSAILNVSDEEYKQMLDEIALILRQYLTLPSAANRKTRKLSIVSSLPSEE